MVSSILQLWKKHKQNGRNSNKENDNGCTERYSSTAMVDDHARRMEAKSILGDTGMFEEELASQFRRHSSIDEGNQLEENIGKCLIDVAKQNCKFIPWEKINKTGAKLFSRSKESICLVSHDQKKIIKLKDPFASRATKGNSPYDIIEELIIHNILFPNTAYKFKGITQDRTNKMRFVLEQEFIESIQVANEKDIANHFKKLGLKDEGHFIFGNQNFAILDAFGSNVILDKNGEMRFIDPIIRIKRR